MIEDCRGRTAGLSPSLCYYVRVNLTSLLDLTAETDFSKSYRPLVPRGAHQRPSGSKKSALALRPCEVSHLHPPFHHHSLLRTPHLRLNRPRLLDRPLPQPHPSVSLHHPHRTRILSHPLPRRLRVRERGEEGEGEGEGWWHVAAGRRGACDELAPSTKTPLPPAATFSWFSSSSESPRPAPT